MIKAQRVMVEHLLEKLHESNLWSGIETRYSLEQGLGACTCENCDWRGCLPCGRDHPTESYCWRKQRMVIKSGRACRKWHCHVAQEKFFAAMRQPHPRAEGGQS